MTAPLEHLLTRFKADPNTVFSPEELELLAAAAPTETWAAKAVALYHARRQDYSKLVTLAEGLVEREPTSDNIINLAVTYRGLGRYAESVELLSRNEQRVDPIRCHDLLA